jgi:hypothetical protein
VHFAAPQYVSMVPIYAAEIVQRYQWVNPYLPISWALCAAFLGNPESCAMQQSWNFNGLALGPVPAI